MKNDLQFFIVSIQGEVVGIGKLKVFASDMFPYTIPTLSFLVVKDNSDLYTASCMQLQIETSSASDTQAIQTLCELCYDFLKGLFTDSRSKDTAWQQLEELYTSDFPNEYYKIYRKVQLQLAKKV